MPPSRINELSQIRNFEEKKMSKKYHIRERCFLNKKIDMRAYVMAVVEDTRDIADCFAGNVCAAKLG